MTTHSATRWLAFFAVLLVSAVFASPAVAGEQEARNLNQKAKAAYSNGEFERAARLLEEAYTEHQNVVYQYNRVRALEGAGEFDKALDVLAKYRDRMREEGYSELDELEQTLIDKRERKRADQSSDSASAGGKTPGAMSDASGPTGASGPAEQTGRTRAGGPTPLTWALFGVSAGALIPGGLLATGLFVDKDDDDALRSQRLTSAILLGTGAATGIAGGLTLLLNNQGGGSTASTSQTTDAATPSVRVAPLVTDGGGGAILQIQFQ